MIFINIKHQKHENANVANNINHISNLSLNKDQLSVIIEIASDIMFGIVVLLVLHHDLKHNRKHSISVQFHFVLANFKIAKIRLE